MAKTPPGDFKVITPENSLLTQQAVTSFLIITKLEVVFKKIDVVVEL